MNILNYETRVYITDFPFHNYGNEVTLDQYHLNILFLQSPSPKSVTYNIELVATVQPLVSVDMGPSFYG